MSGLRRVGTPLGFGVGIVLLIGWATAAFSAPAAFPGAEGFGALAEGGRGGTVLFVDNLNDSGPGSLRAAVETSGPRTVIFRVGGTIDLQSTLLVSQPFLTLAGQTAPGGGIAIKRGMLRIGTHDVIVRGLRARPGDELPDGTAPTERDAISVSASETGQDIHDVIIDHCTLSWGVDETLSTWTNQVRDVTVQWSMINEGLFDSIHQDEGASQAAPHSSGALFGRDADHISLHHNLMAHNDDRNPSLAGVVNMEVINNLIYNWKSGPGRVSDDRNVVHWINNYFRLGPGYLGNISRSDTFRFGDNPHPQSAYYLSGNIRHSTFSNRPPVSEEEWNVVNGDTTPIVGIPATTSDPVGVPGLLLFTPSSVVVDDAVVARDVILAQAGALHPQRDAADLRIIDHVVNIGGGIIDKPEDAVAAGDSRFDDHGYPILANGTAPSDNDGDGLPNSWENNRSYLSRNNASDAVEDHDGDGYTNREEYLNSFYMATHVRTGLVGYYRCNNASGATSDASGQDNHLTFKGVFVGPSEIEGERCRFDNDDAAELSDPLDLSAFSVSLWVKADNWGDGGSSDYHALFYRLAGDSLYPRASLKADGRIKLQLRTNGVTQAVTTSSADAISDFNWHHLAFTFDDVTGVGTLSLDGELVLSHTFEPGALDSGNHTAKLGRNDNQNISLQGRLDEVRIYDRVLTPHEIRILSGP